MSRTFRSLSNANYRLWAAGAIVSNVGTWMQRTAQDWVVLTQLTHNNATSVGVVVALQFGPQVFLLPLTGYAADHFDRRKLLIATQATMGLLALALGLLVITGRAQLWNVYGLALALGCAAAFDAPARQTFVSDLVGETDLSNAVALNATSFNAARLIGPAISGLLIAAVGSGWVFLGNAASYIAVIGSLLLIRADEMHVRERPIRTRRSLLEGFRYVWMRPDLRAVLFMAALIGTLGLNFAIFISAMSVRVFGATASQFGLLTSIMALGSVAGALLAARRSKPQLKILVIGAAVFGLGLASASLAPNYWLFGLTLIVVGAAAQTFTTSSVSYVQLSIDPQMRGRVLAILMAVALGGAPIGAPLIGGIADVFGPRWSVALGAASGIAAALTGIVYLASAAGLRPRFEGGRLRLAADDEPPREVATEFTGTPKPSILNARQPSEEPGGFD